MARITVGVRVRSVSGGASPRKLLRILRDRRIFTQVVHVLRSTIVLKITELPGTIPDSCGLFGQKRIR